MWAIIQRELLLEWRQRSSLFGMLLYLVSLVFLMYNLQAEPESLVWNTLIWLSVLFVAINSVAKSFMAESRGRWLYYYTVHSPQQMLMAKLLYHSVYMLIVAACTLLLFYFFMGFPAINKKMFIGLFFLGSVSFALLFTFLSAIVSKVNNNPTLLAVLGFPLVLPLLLLLGDLSVSAFQPVRVEGWNSFLWSLIAMNVLIVGMSYILFPFLWREN